MPDIRTEPALRLRVPLAVAASLVASGLVALAAFIVLSTVFFTVITHVPLPQADEWFSFEVYDRILREGHPWERLFELHNEHRLFFPRLVYFSDYRFFGGRSVLDKAVIVAVQALEAGLFVFLLGRSNLGTAARMALGAVAAVLLFSLHQGENFAWAFQVAFVGVFASASLSVTLFAMSLDAEGRGARHGGLRIASFLLAFVSTFTMANGLIAGLVLVLLACVARAPWRVVLGTAVLAAGLIAGFSLGYRLDDDSPRVADLLHHVPRLVAFTAGYLGNFLRSSLWREVAFGGVGIAATLALAGAMAWTRDRDPVRLSLLGIALFVAGSAALTAIGRSAAGLGDVESSRYSTGAAAFWAATLINAWSQSGRWRAGVLGRVAVSLGALVLLQTCWNTQLAMGADMERRATDYGVMEDALLLGFFDEPAFRAFEDHVDKAREMVPELRRLGLSVFAGRDARLLDQPLSEVETPGAAAIPCAGSFASAVAAPEVGPDAATVSGTSSLRPRFGRPGRVYLVDGERRIVGFARTGFRGGAWKGYARAAPGSTLDAYAVSDGGRTCRLGSAIVR